MTESVYRKVVTPSRCAFVLCFPVTKDDFYESKARPASDYTKRFWNFLEYRKRFLDDYLKLRLIMSRLGVHIIENASLTDFSQVWGGAVDAVVLFSHWSDERVEYHDGLETIERVIEQIPTYSVGTLDLCVCHPRGLVDRLARDRGLLLVKSIWVTANPIYWCMFYITLFQVLASRSLSYPDALDQTLDAWLDRLNRGRKGNEE
jgi:hypothetical protein